MHEDSAFIYHWKAFQKELSLSDRNKRSALDNLTDSYASYINGLRELAPYGYIKDWDWDDENGFVTMSLSFVNTRKSKIRYIAFHFIITNDVGDVRCQGVFRGTGPVEEFHTCSWEWNDSSYYTWGDSSKMKFTKVVLTYMDGSQKILTGGNIVVDDDD